MKAFVLLATLGTVLAQVSPAPPQIPTPRSQPSPPTGPGSANNPAIGIGQPRSGSFQQSVVGAPGPNLPNAGFSIDPVITPTVSNSVPLVIQPVGTNIGGTPTNFAFVTTNPPAGRAFGTNPPLGRTIITNTFPGTVRINPGLAPTFPPSAAGTAPSAQRGASPPVIDLPPGTIVRPAPQPPTTPRNPGPVIPR